MKNIIILYYCDVDCTSAVKLSSTVVADKMVVESRRSVMVVGWWLLNSHTFNLLTVM